MSKKRISQGILFFVVRKPVDNLHKIGNTKSVKTVLDGTIIKEVTHIYEKTYGQTAAGALKG